MAKSNAARQKAYRLRRRTADLRRNGSVTKEDSEPALMPGSFIDDEGYEHSYVCSGPDGSAVYARVTYHGKPGFKRDASGAWCAVLLEGENPGLPVTASHVDEPPRTSKDGREQWHSVARG